MLFKLCMNILGYSECLHLAFNTAAITTAVIFNTTRLVIFFVKIVMIVCDNTFSTAASNDIILDIQCSQVRGIPLNPLLLNPLLPLT